MGPLGFEPRTASAPGWYPTMLDDGPFSRFMHVAAEIYKGNVWANLRVFSRLFKLSLDGFLL